MKYLAQLIYYCLTFSLICVLARGANPVNILYFYPKEIQNRVLELGLTNKKAMTIRRNIVLLLMILVMAGNLYLIILIWNKAENFDTIFYQALFFLQVWNIYDGVLMDKLWLEKSDFWIIPEIKIIWKAPDWLTLLKRRLIYVPGLFLAAFLVAKLFILF